MPFRIFDRNAKIARRKLTCALVLVGCNSNRLFLLFLQVLSIALLLPMTILCFLFLILKSPALESSSKSWLLSTTIEKLLTLPVSKSTSAMLRPRKPATLRPRLSVAATTSVSIGLIMPKLPPTSSTVLKYCANTPFLSSLTGNVWKKCPSIR